MDQHTAAPATPSEQVAGEIRAAMARRRISGAQLARRLGWAQSYVARRIDGRVPIDLNDLTLIAEALEVTVADLLPAGVLKRRPVATDGPAMGPSFALAERRRAARARRRRVAVRRRRDSEGTDDTRPSSHSRSVATTPMTRRPVLIPRTSTR